MVYRKFTFAFLFAAGAIIFASCAAPMTMHKSFISKKSSLSYMHDSDEDRDSTSFVVTVVKPEVTYPLMNSTGIVRQTKAKAVPLIFVNFWQCQYEYLLGKAGIQEDIATFVQSSVTEEANRSGSFKALDTPAENALSLEIEIDSIGAIGSYQTSGYFYFLGFFYGYGSDERAEPGTAFSRFHYKLKRGDVLLMEDVTTAQQVSKPLQTVHKSPEALRSFYNANLVEALSGTIKTNIEIMIEDIDLFLYEEQVRANSSSPPSDLESNH